MLHQAVKDDSSQSKAVDTNVDILVYTMLYSSASGYDSSLMKDLQPLNKWQEFMDRPIGAWLGFVTAIQAVGDTCGYPTMAYAANRWGGKKCLCRHCDYLTAS